MKIWSALILVLLGSLFSVRTAFAQTTKPSISIVSPEKNAVVPARSTLHFSIENFNLTAKPLESSSSGVISLYVDGAFFETFASSSAQIYIPRSGTHYVEAELVNVNRTSFTPRILDTAYLNVQKKTPYIRVLNLKQDGVVFDSHPTLQMELMNIEKGKQYYKVFVDGVLDGSSKDSEDPTNYTLSNELIPDSHALKIALYNENDSPVYPVVEVSLNFNYSLKKPRIKSIDLPKQVSLTEKIPFTVEFENFNPGKDGKLGVVNGNGAVSFYSEATGELNNLKPGANKISFALYDNSGVQIVADPPQEKIITVESAATINNQNKAFFTGLFTTAEDQRQPRWVFIGLAGIEAIAIIVFAVLLFKRGKE